MITHENEYLSQLSEGKIDPNPYYGLFSVFENKDKFITPVLTEEEKSRQLLFTKYHKFKNYKEGESVINSKQEFEKYFDLITNNVFLCMNWSNVLIAGGSVSSLLSSVPVEYKTSDEKIQEWFSSFANFGDIDIFLYGLTDRQATKKIFEIYENIKSVIPKEILCIRGPRAISFVMGSGYRHIQIILRNFKTLPEILLSFDINICSFGYDGENIWCSPRSCYAMTRAVNTVNVTKKSPSYEYRLTKYGKRGYAVYIPNFTEDNLNEQIYLKPPYQLKGLARLLVLEKLDDNVKYQIYKDVLDLHQASMRKNLNYKSEYEDSDYNKIYLPEWTEEFRLDDVQAIMKKKFEQLNKGAEFVKHYCFYGKLNDVIMGKTVKLPTFETVEEKQNYDRSYVNGRLKFHSITDKDFKELGVFTASCVKISDKDVLQWYHTAYHDATNKNTVIEYATNNQPDKISELLDYGKLNRTNEEYQIWKKSMLNSRDIANRVPLHQAIFREDECMVFFLLECGVDITYVSKLGKTALHTACEVGNLNIVKLLIESQQVSDDKSLINVMDSYKLTPILYSLMYGNVEVFKYLYKYVKKDDLVWIFKYDKNKNYRALKMCLLFRQYEIAKFLLLKGYDINDYYLKNSKNSIHILEDAVKSYDYDMFNVLLNYHNSTEDSGLKYRLENLQYLSKNLQQKYNKAVTKQSRDYYSTFITKLYDIHGNKTGLYELLSDMIVYHRFDDFKEYIKENEVNLSLVNNGESLLDNVESKITWIKSNIASFKNNVKNLQSSKKQLVKKYQYTTGQISFDNDEIYIVPSWIISNEVSHVINSSKTYVSNKPETQKLEEEIESSQENLKYYEKVKKFLTGKGVVSMIKKNFKQKSIKQEVTRTKKSTISSECSDDYSDEDVLPTKPVPVNSSIIQNVNIVVMSSKKVPINDQQTYLELFDDIRSGSDLDEYELSEFDLECYLSKSQMTLLQAALQAENFNAFTLILKYMVDNRKVILEKKKKIVRNNLKLKKLVSNNTKESESESEEEEEEENIFKYVLDSKTIRLILAGLMEIISQTESSTALSYLLFELLEMREIYDMKDFLNVAISEFWNYIKIFISNNSYKLIDVLIKFYNESNLTISTESNQIINSVFLQNDLEGLMTFFKSTKSCKNKIEFEDNILLDYLCNIKANPAVTKTKIPAKVVKLLLEIKPSLLNCQVNGTYPVVFASECDMNIFELILSNLPDINVYDSYGKNAIHSSVLANKVENIKLLLTTYPEQVNSQTKIQLKTPLMLGSSSYGTTIDTILSFKPNEEIVDVFGNTALHYGMIKANIFLVNKLKFHNRENYIRMTPSDYIVNNYKSYFHHIRNEKLGSQLDKKKLSFIVEIYKKCVSKKASDVRILANYSDVVKVNKYILNSIPEGVREIPNNLRV
jgi:ankyrin repeat protein